MYETQIGRFISEDPIGFDSDTNLYRYVGNDPTNYTDPSGLVLMVDGAALTQESELYKQILRSINDPNLQFPKEMLDLLIKSESTFRYSKDSLLREIEAQINYYRRI